jgi:cyclic di-GMP phosphodiesterase Gmr
MYNRKINIAILSETAYLEDILLKVNVSDEFSLSFKTINPSAQIDSNNIDILIDDSSDDFLNTIQTLNNNLLILCVNKLQLAAVTKTVEDKVADIWLKPFETKMIQFQFQKLVRHVILKRKYRLSQICLDTLMNNVPDLIWFKHLNGIHLKVNNEFCSTVGKTKQDIEGYDHYHIWNINKEEYENSEYVCLDTDSIVIQSKKPGIFDEKVEGQRGMRQLKTYKSPIIDDSGELIGTVGVAHDVTELKNIDTTLELILNTIPFAIMVKGLDNCVLNINRKFEEFFQISKKDIIGKPYHIHERLTTNDSNPPNLLFYEHDKEIRLQHNGTEIILKIDKEPMYDFFENLVGILYIYREVTVERNFEEQLKILAYTDPLTGLFTRRYLYEYIGETITVPNINLLYIDLDNFKLINDTYGHHCGDRILKDIGGILQENFPDDLCVRMGGDEFLIVIIGKSSIVDLKKQSNTLLQTINTRFSIFPTEQQLSVSIGIATFEGNSPIPLDELLKKSDIALYEAKNNGKEQYVIYSPTLENS